MMILLERFVTAAEAIAAALTTIAANTKGTLIATPEAGTQAATTDKTAGNNEAQVPKKQRSRPAAGETIQAGGIKDSDKPVATIVAEALFGDQKPSTDTPDEVMDYEVLKRAVLEVGSYSEQGRQAVIKMLGEYGVKNAKDVAPEKREEFHGKLLVVLTDLQNDEANAEDEFA